MPSAGEVEQFVYCPHNWYLARQGVDPHAQARHGIAEHERLARIQDKAAANEHEQHRALRWMFRVLAVAASTTFLTIELIFLRANPLHWLLLLTALVMVSASAALLIIASIMERRAAYHVRQGALPGTRAIPPGRTMEDPEWGVSGEPDSILQTDHGAVPVEVKTGQTPETPFDSHAMQLAVYLRLLEAKGEEPEYGLLTYPDGVFRIAWDAATRDRLRAVLSRMDEAVKAGRADRDHEHVARCVGCARRGACDQRLG